MQNQKNYLTKELAEKVVKTAIEKGLKIATAESCTGGLLSGALTSVDGSSKCFVGGICTYDPALKAQFLKVEQDLIDNDKLVSMECAKAMCEGLKALINCDIAITTTGIAGPSTDSHNTAIGTVYYGLRYQNKCKVFSTVMGESRDEVRELAVYHALEILFETVDEEYTGKK